MVRLKIVGWIRESFLIRVIGYKRRRRIIECYPIYKAIKINA